MTGVKGSIPWNKGKKGYSIPNKVIKELNWEKVFNEIKNGRSVNQIAKQGWCNVTDITLRKYVKIKRPDLIRKLNRKRVGDKR